VFFSVLSSKCPNLLHDYYTITTKTAKNAAKKAKKGEKTGLKTWRIQKKVVPLKHK